jgi:hypothetical protein
LGGCSGGSLPASQRLVTLQRLQVHSAPMVAMGFNGAPSRGGWAL